MILVLILFKLVNYPGARAKVQYLPLPQCAISRLQFLLVIQFHSRTINVTTKPFNDRLRKALKERRIKHSTLAEMLGITRPGVSRWCTTDCVIGSNFLVPLSKALGVSVLWLLTGQDAEIHHTLRERRLIKLICIQDKETQKCIEVILQKIKDI